MANQSIFCGYIVDRFGMQNQQIADGGLNFSQIIFAMKIDWKPNSIELTNRGYHSIKSLMLLQRQSNTLWIFYMKSLLEKNTFFASFDVNPFSVNRKRSHLFTLSFVFCVEPKSGSCSVPRKCFSIVRQTQKKIDWFCIFFKKKFPVKKTM